MRASLGLVIAISIAIVAVFVVPLISVRAQHIECTYVAQGGSVYDLASLFFRPSDPASYFVQDLATNHTFTFNICGPLFDETSFFPNCFNTSCAVCQLDTNFNSHNCGRGNQANSFFSTYAANPSGGVQLTYTGGDMCNRAQVPRNTTITVLCNPSSTIPVIGNAGVENLIEAANCSYQINMTASAGCPVVPNNGGGGGFLKAKVDAGSIIFIVLMTGILLYLVVGLVFNSQVRGRHGRDALPNVEFWRGFFSLVSDGCMFVGNGCSNRSREAYQTIDTSNKA